MRPAIIGFKEGWSLMENGVTKLLNLLESRPEEPFNSNTHMKLYTTVYNMCVQQAPNDFSEALYNGYKGVFKNHCDGTVLPSLRERHGEFLLREFVDRWATHVTMIRWMRNFFSYLDRFYVSKRSVQPLKEAAVDCFRESVYEGIKVKVRDAVIRLIRQEREGEQIDRALLKNVLDVFIAMGKPSSDKALEYYQLDFEAPMLEDTVDYYSRKASVWIGHDTCPEYMFKAEECLRREKERASHYLHASSEVKLLSNAERQLLTVRSSQLLEKEHSGCRALLRDDKEDDLSRMYRLFVRVPDNGLNPVASIFKQHVTEEGLKLVDQAQEAAGDKKPGKIDASTCPEQVFVAKVIELHDKYLGYVRDCFLSHTLFHKALKDAFEVFCNKNIAGSSSAEVLSLFCDTIMKKGGSEEATEETFDKVVALLSYFGDKDLFAEFSRKKLARRLLFDRSANEEQERSLLMKLKHQYGAQFTSKMEGMVTDMMLAREVQTEFEECKTQKHHHQGGVDLIASVLTTGFWPTYKSSDLNLPAEMAKCVESFKEFYGAKTKQRKLTWIYSLGTCTVVGNFDTKKIELVVTTYQASLLVLFNESDRLSYSEIKEQLNLGDEDVVRLLHSLSCTKYKILSKEPNTKTVSPTDTFEFNSKFTDKMRRIKIPLPPVDDKKKVIQDVTKERRLTVDACIVRIMKSRKVLGHQELVLECAAQLTKLFRADNKIIKQRIEDLISRDFLERDLDNSNVYKYVA